MTLKLTKAERSISHYFFESNAGLFQQLS